jgi:hypothetical protein
LEIDDREIKTIASAARLRQEPRKLDTTKPAIPNLTPSNKAKLELISHQIQFFSHRLHYTLRLNCITPYGKEKLYATKDLEQLIALANNLKDLYEVILYASHEKDTNI